MRANKKLIGGIAFLALQLVAILVNGFPRLDSGAYGMGYLVGLLIPGVIGIMLLIAYFREKNEGKK